MQLNNDIEGFGIAMYEAMAQGCIPVAPDILINSEIITNEYNGFLFKENNVYSIIDNLKQIDEEKILLLSKNARKSVKSYSNKNYIEKIIKLIH